MNRIKTTSWEQYKLTDLFDIILPIGDIQAQKMNDGEFPLVSSGKNNNGICKYISSTKESKLIQANSITVDMFGKAFFQPKKFYCVSHGRVNILIPKFYITRNIGLFLSKIIEKITIPKYEFLDMCSKSALEKEMVLLPSSNNQPDWEYMEVYMKNIMQEAEDNIKNLRNIDNCKKEIDISRWQKYRLGNLFYKCNLNKKDNFNKKSDVSLEKTDEFNLPLVNAKHYNNGIMYYGRSSDFDSEVMTLDIVQNGAASVGDVYAQPQQTGVLEDAYLIKAYDNIVSINILQFLATVIQKDIKQHFSYDNKCTWDKAKEMLIHLPAKSNGNPDWEYMENYMKNIELQASTSLKNLKNVIEI